MDLRLDSYTANTINNPPSVICAMHKLSWRKIEISVSDEYPNPELVRKLVDKNGCRRFENAWCRIAKTLILPQFGSDVIITYLIRVVLCSTRRC